MKPLWAVRPDTRIDADAIELQLTESTSGRGECENAGREGADSAMWSSRAILYRDSHPLILAILDEGTGKRGQPACQGFELKRVWLGKQNSN